MHFSKKAPGWTISSLALFLGYNRVGEHMQELLWKGIVATLLQQWAKKKPGTLSGRKNESYNSLTKTYTLKNISISVPEIKKCFNA
jgi:hypothetical protein